MLRRQKSKDAHNLLPWETAVQFVVVIFYVSLYVGLAFVFLLQGLLDITKRVLGSFRMLTSINWLLLH